MEWQTGSFQQPGGGLDPEGLSTDPFVFSLSPVAPSSQSVFGAANHPNSAFTSVAGLSDSIEPHASTFDPPGFFNDGDIPPAQGGVAPTAQAQSAYDETPVASLLPSSEAGQDLIGANANIHSALAWPNSATIHQPHQAPARISPVPRRENSRPALECKWDGCPSTTRFSSKGDLLRHIKSIHISPDAFPCQLCGCTFGRRDHLRDHQRRRHRGFV